MNNNSDLLNTNLDLDNNLYLLNNNTNYKTLILYMLKPLDNDIRRTIYDILIEHEKITKLEYEWMIELIQQDWTELTISTIYDLYEHELDELQRLDELEDIDLYSDQ